MRLQLLGISLVAWASACAFPRYTTMVQEAPPAVSEGGELTPPPEELHRLSVVRAELPLRTRDGRDWDDDGTGPDAYVVISRNGSELYRTRTIQNSARPEWNAQSEFVDARVLPTDRIKIEVFEADGMGASAFVSMLETTGIAEEARDGGYWNVRLEGGTYVQIQSVHPRPKLGMGLTWEYRNDRIVVVSVVSTGPANGAGLKPGDVITAIDGKQIKELKENEVRTALDAGTQRDVLVSVLRNGASSDVYIRRDALYVVR